MKKLIKNMDVLLKLLERILLTRIQLFDTVNPPIRAMQGDYKKCRLSYDFTFIT